MLLVGAGMAVFLFARSGPERPPEPVAIIAEPIEPAEPIQPTEPVVTTEPVEPEITIEPEVTTLVDETQSAPPTGLTKPDPALRYRVSFEGAHLRGAEDAPITIVLFYDFECPFCQRVNKSLAEVTGHYGSDVRIAYMHNPLGWHDSALPAAKAVEAAAAQGKFWEMHELLFKDPSALTRSNFDAFARQLGLDKKRFDQVFDDPATEGRIMAQQAEAARLRAHGIPSCFINGRFLTGARPFESFATLIDAELEVARQLIAEGTARGAVYETLMRDALPGV